MFPEFSTVDSRGVRTTIDTENIYDASVRLSIDNNLKFKMRPLLLHGHSRPVTCVQINKDGDLLLSAAKDRSPALWLTSNGEKIGTYEGHTGAVYYIDVNDTSTLVATASADETVRIWELETGKQLFQIDIESAARCVKWSNDQNKILVVQDNARRQQTKVYVYEIDNLVQTNFDASQQSRDPIVTLKDDNITQKLSRAVWFANDTQIITSGDDGCIRRWNAITGELIQIQSVSDQPINNMRLSRDGNMLITANTARNAKVFDSRTFKKLKEYESQSQVNGADISPNHPLVITAGGQPAMAVAFHCDTKTLLVRYYHLVFENLLGTTKGHFGPANDLVFMPDGSGFVSAGEDSYIRIHYFDDDFLKMCEGLEKIQDEE